jgi:ferrous iron transport protein A
MPLLMIRPGEKGNIKKITGEEKVTRFLENIGFVVGSEVTVVCRAAGNLIVNVKDSRVAISNEMAKRIMV